MGNPNVKNLGKKFSSEYQPSPEAKSGKRRVTQFKEAMLYFGEQLKKKINVEGEEVELTFESNIAYELLKKANEGDLKAIQIIIDANGWKAPQEIELNQKEVNFTFELIKPKE